MSDEKIVENEVKHDEFAVTPPAPADMDLKQRNAVERDYYLGRTNVIPFTDGMTVADGKKKYREAVDAQNKDLDERMKKYDRDKDIERAGDPPVNVTELPDAEAMKGMGRNNVVEQAQKEGIDVERGDTIPVIIDKIIAGRKESDSEIIDPANDPTKKKDDEEDESAS